MFAQDGQQAGPVGHQARGHLVGQPGGDRCPRVDRRGHAGAELCGGTEVVVRRWLDQARSLRVVGASPALLPVPCVAHVVEVAAPPRGRRVEGQPAVELDPGDKDMDVHALGAADPAVLHGGPRVPVSREAGERDPLEVGQDPGDVLSPRPVVGMERDDRRAVPMHRAQGIGCGRDLSGIADQNLDVIAHAPGVVTLAGEVLDRLARRSRPMCEELDVHRRSPPRPGQSGPEHHVHVARHRLQHHEPRDR